MSRHMSLQKVIDQLNIGDALAFKGAFPGDSVVEACYEARINPMRYLSYTFKHSVTLLSVMFDTGCILSGSRALDFFIPGSATVESGWDFYVPGCKESVADMIGALSKSGIEWDLAGDRLVAALSHSGRADIDGAALQALQSWTNHLSPEDATDLLGQKLYAILQGLQPLGTNLSAGTSYKIMCDPAGVVRDEGEEEEGNPQAVRTMKREQSNKNFSILDGRVRTKMGFQSVRLIIGHDDQGSESCLNFIKDHYASHVQCFIGGWCASHMYYCQASRKESAQWNQSSGAETGTSSAIERAIEKYQNRGFRFYRPVAEEPVIRHLHDDQALFVDYGHLYEPYVRKSNLDLLKFWLTERRKNLDSVQWVEFGGNIVTLYSPIQMCLRKHASYAVSKWALPLTRLRRLADIVSLNACDADITGVAVLFRSTLWKTLSGVNWYIPEVARSGMVFGCLRDATPWVWAM